MFGVLEVNGNGAGIVQQPCLDLWSFSELI